MVLGRGMGLHLSVLGSGGRMGVSTLGSGGVGLLFADAGVLPRSTSVSAPGIWTRVGGAGGRNAAVE